jgi:hypothetical protein
MPRVKPVWPAVPHGRRACGAAARLLPMDGFICRAFRNYLMADATFRVQIARAVSGLVRLLPSVVFFCVSVTVSVHPEMPLVLRI